MSSSRQADRELKKFEEAQREAERVAFAKSLKAISAELQTFWLPIEPSAADFLRLIQSRQERYFNIASLLLSITKEDGKTEIKVPVTPKSQDEPDKQSFHSISIRCDDGAVLEILIRENDNYVVGFRVYLNIEARNETPWRTFGAKLPSRLGVYEPTKYKSQHVELEKVQFGQGILLKIVNFLKDLQLHPEQEMTDLGQRYVCTLFILFGEAQRFAKAKQWVLNAIDSPIALTPKAPLTKLFRDWSGLSKTGMELYVAMWEERNLLFKYKDRFEHQAGYVNPYESLVKIAKEACIRKELEHHAANLCFRSRPTSEVDLSLLLGGELLLVCHDDEFSCKAIIREGVKYDAPWPDDGKVTWE